MRYRSPAPASCSNDLSSRSASSSGTASGASCASLHTAVALATVTPAGNTATRSASSRSSSVSSSQLHSTTARSVRCRGNAVRLPPVSSRKRSDNRSATSLIDIARSRAAASSIASGKPSSRRTISTTAPMVRSSMTTSGRAAAARSANSRTAGNSSANSTPLPVGRLAERRHGEHDLADDAERFAAGREHAHVRAQPEQVFGQARTRVDHVLAVVEHDHRGLVGEHVGEPGLGVLRRGRGAAIEQVLLAQSERAEHGLRHVGAVGHGGEFGEPDTVAHHQLRPGLAGKPGLARSARADDRDEPMLGERLRDPRQFLVAADEARELRAQVAAAMRQRRLGLAAQHRQVRGLQLCAGIDTEFVGEAMAQVVVRVQRIGLASRGGERGDQCGTDALVERVFVVQCGEIGQRALRFAERELGRARCRCGRSRAAARIAPH